MAERATVARPYAKAAFAAAREQGRLAEWSRWLGNARGVVLSEEFRLLESSPGVSTAQLEELIDELRQNYCIVIVTHSMQQAARVSQLTAFFHLGTLVEYGDTDEMFTAPQEKRTQDYITGRFG